MDIVRLSYRLLVGEERLGVGRCSLTLFFLEKGVGWGFGREGEGC